MSVANNIGLSMRGLIQQDRLVTLDTPLGANTLLPQRIVGCSRIGRDFEFTVDAVSTTERIELKQLIAQPVTLWIQQADSSYKPHNGYVHTARRLGADGGLTSFQLSFASWMHFLRFRRDQRIWQDKSVDEIVTDIFNAHPQAKGVFRFALSSPLPARSYCRQDEDDWNFVHRLLESEGLYGVWQQAQDGKSHTLVITDRLLTLGTLSPETVQFYRAGTRNEADALTQWTGSRTMQSVTLTTRTFDYKNPSTPYNPKGTSVPTMPNQGALPEQAEVYEYTGAYTYPRQDRGDQLSRIRMEEWESRAKRFHGAGGLRGVDAGLRFILTDHPDHDGDSQSQREFAVIEVAWAIENNLPVSAKGKSFPHSLQTSLAEARANHAGDALTSVRHMDGSDGFYLVEIEAQRTTVPFRSPLEHGKPEMHLESAMVVGPKGEEVYTDELNRVKVQFIWDRLNNADDRASCWIRVAQSDTGNGYGGVHIPRVGEEVLVDYIGGDCDRPIITSRIYNAVTKPQWHTDALLSGYRSKEYGGAGYNQMVFDDSTGQNRVQLYSTSSRSQLHLGYLTQQDGNSRGRYLGAGFDLKSDAYGAVRAGMGLYISTHPASVEQPLDASDTRDQLTRAQTLIESLSQASITAQAEDLSIGQSALKDFSQGTEQAISAPGASGGKTGGGGTGSANGFSAPLLLIGSPSGVAVATQKAAHVSADQQVNLVSGDTTYVSTGKSLIASAAEKISLFVQKAGMRLIAAKGKVEVSAQSDEIRVSAAENITVTSANGRVTIQAKDELILQCGGSYIRITPSGIEDGMSGARVIKSASFSRQGPSSMAEHFNSRETTAFNDPYVLHDKISGELLRNHPYEIARGDGSIIKGMTDAEGKTSVQKSDDVETVLIRILPRSDTAG
ncbi:MAG: type VI secretion system Vgr family protein [Paraburkholderia sp.]|uniref:type VI secretion system Vgr family protein n=1 Tax=Paraburkholderia sp. TaxID=1926495 RepID=UPI00397BC4CB